MPTVLRVQGYQFFIYPDDHEPAHVHVFKSGEEAKISIGDDDHAPEAIDPMRMPTHEVRQAVRIAQRFQGQFLAAWRKYHA
jgi:hypothetical protein